MGTTDQYPCRACEYNRQQKLICCSREVEVGRRFLHVAESHQLVHVFDCETGPQPDLNPVLAREDPLCLSVAGQK